MDNEKYGIELELITNKFKQKIQEIKSTITGIGKQKVDLGTNTAQLEYLKQQIKEISDLLNSNAKKPFMDYNDVLRNRAELEKLINQYNKLIQKQNESAKASKNSTSGISKSIEGMTSKIKRFGLSLFGIRSIFALVSRASSAYLSQDTELANKLQSAWIGLGAILAPIIQFITTLILKVISVINGFIKALTGVDLIAKASAKSMKSAAGSARALHKALAGFDELNNLDTDAGGGTGGGFGNLLDPFATVDEDWSTMIGNIKTKVEDFRKDFTKKNLAMLEENKKILRKAGYSEEFIEMYDYATRGAIDAMNGFFDVFSGIMTLIDGIVTQDTEKIREGVTELLSGLGRIVLGFIQEISGLIGTLRVFIWEHLIKPVGDWFGNLFKNIGDSLNNIKNKFKEFGTSVANAVGSAFKTIINAVLSRIETQLNKPISAINSLISVINAVPGINLGRLSKISLPRLATGTNYVPQDQVAMIHKGEAVIPKKFNSREYFGSGNEETNYKLDQLIEAVREIEINPYTTIRDVGKASLNYINSKSRQLGESVVV